MRVVQLKSSLGYESFSTSSNDLCLGRSKYERTEDMHDEQGATQLQDFHHSGITDAQHHFDDVEITLAHALEIRIPASKIFLEAA